jgi:MFS family permease
MKPPPPAVQGPASSAAEPPHARRSLLSGSLWRSRDFLKLWGGQSVSQVGTAVTILALPTTAIQLLGAGPTEIGYLSAIQLLAFPLLGLFVGVWVDRMPRRPVLIVCDLARMLALASVPAAFFLHELSMGQLYVVALVIGVCSVFFEVAYQSYLPTLVRRSELIEANGKLQASRQVAQVAGPAVAGGLIELVRAAPAILIDSASYLVSVLTVLSIGTREPRPKPAGSGRAGFARELAEGLRVVFAHPTIRLLAGSNATANLGAGIIDAVFLVYAYKELQLGVSTMGGLFAVASLSAVVGASVAARLARRFGLGPTLALAALLFRASYLLVALLPQSGQPVIVLGAILVLSRVSEPVYNVNQLSLRQALVPSRLQGRLAAVIRTVSWGAIPIGFLIGGFLGTHIGLAPTIVLGAAVTMLAALWILAGPIRLREQPTAMLPGD